MDAALEAELKRSSRALLPLIHRFRMIELGLPANPAKLPDMLSEAALSASAFATALEASGVANELNAMLRDKALLGFQELRNPPAVLCRKISEAVAAYQPEDGLPQIELPEDRVRQLLTISLSPEQVTALHAYLTDGNSFTDYLRDGAKFMLDSARLLRPANLRLPPAPSRSRQAPSDLLVESKGEQERKKKQVEMFISGLGLAAALAAGWCFLTGGVGCLVAIILGLDAAGVRFLVSLK
jgi:hypothetical protein